MKKCLFILSIQFYYGCLLAADVKNLRCEYFVNPMGVDVAYPRFCWEITSTRRGDIQRAFQMLVSSSAEKLSKNDGDIWDTGKFISDQSIQVTYRGKPLQSGTKYFWKVRVWDADNKSSRWSDPSFWFMGLLTPGNWQLSEWIGNKDESMWKKEWKQHKENELSNLPSIPSWPWKTGMDSTIFKLYEMPDPKYDPAPLFRKEFNVTKKIRSAHLFVCGLGYYEAWLNGKRVGDHVLDPAWTNFEQRCLYATYDVTKLIKSGSNAIGVMLGRGQYNPLCNDIWGLSNSYWIDQPKLIALLQIISEDGAVRIVKTDSSWKTAGGPIVYDDTRQGELYDARLEQPGWSSPDFIEIKWKQASVLHWNARLESQMIPPIRCYTPIRPIKIYSKGRGITAYDLGKNIAGWGRIKVKGPSGTRVLVEYSETPSDKELLPNLSDARFEYNIKDKQYASFFDKYVNVRQQNGYILRGEGEEIIECHFSYKGFQFMRITADNGVKIEDVQGIPVHSDVEKAGDFICSNPLVNQLQNNSVNSLLNNYHSIVTDCPHREKQGWDADNYMSSQAAVYNFNMASFYSKWITDLAGTQTKEGGLCIVAPSSGYGKNMSTTWPAAIVFIPWDLLKFYADSLTLTKNLEVMDRFAKSSLLRQVAGKPEIINDVLGDWVSPKMEEKDSINYIMAPPEGMLLYGTASQYLLVKKLAWIYKFLGRLTEADKMEKWSKKIFTRFNEEFFDMKRKIYHGDQQTGYRQSPNIIALDYGLVPEDNKKYVLQNLIKDIHDHADRIGTGFLGTASLMEYLPLADPSLAYTLATQPLYPGWGYMIKQGAGSMWETWDGFASHNHTPFCLISGYFYKYLAGIQPEISSPGFKHFIINPWVTGELTFVDSFHDCLFGRIESKWRLDGGRLTMQISVPVNTSATVYIPKKRGSVITESGNRADLSAGIRFLGEENGKAIYSIGSGNYIFRSFLH